MNIDANSIEVGSNSVALSVANLVSQREILEVLAFLCQIKLKKRDFEWDSGEMQSQMQIVWRHWELSLTVVSRFLLDLSLVGLLSKVGDGQFRFSHMTLQEYFTASCAVRIFGDQPKMLHNLFSQLMPLHSRWNREMLQFTACMPQLQDEMFVEFCGFVLKSDGVEGVHCELVQDRAFLKGRGSCEKVEEMVCSRLQEIRGTDFFLAGLCHSSLEVQNGVLSEIKKFSMPPDRSQQSCQVFAACRESWKQGTTQRTNLF